MTDFIARTCTEFPKGDSRDRADNPSLPLEDFREVDAFVLLGAPGAGKTRAFEREAECAGGLYISARDFTTFDENPEWRDTTLYIDGLDETRAGLADGRTPFDNIRAKLEHLGRPRFRLSCREADWLGTSDRGHLKTVSPGNKVQVLRLDPLSDDGIREFLHRSGIEDADGFIASARERGIAGLLVNPKSLEMLATAVKGSGVWPDTRMQTFDMACQTLIGEHNQEHRIAERGSVGIPVLMDAAGRLCAIQLLTGSAGYTLLGSEGDRAFPELERIPGEDSRILRRVSDTKLFEAPSEGRVTPVHRQIAEFLAARYLFKLIDNGLPTRRVLALMTGHDGAVVSELRGLSAWLAAHSKTSRKEIVQRDPLGTVLYGDVREFSVDEKRQVLDCLAREAKRNPWFVRAIQMDSRLGELVSPEMEAVFKEILTEPARDDARQSFALILIESLRHGQPLPGLSGSIMRLLRDDTWWPRIRFSAVKAFVRHRQDSGKAFAELELLASDVYAGRVSDPDDDLLGCLLNELYPAKLSVTEILQYLRAPRNPSHLGIYELFWTSRTPKNSTSAQLVELLDLLVEQFERLRPVFAGSQGQFNFLNKVPATWLRRFFETSPKSISPERLFDWFGVLSKPELRTLGEDAEFFRQWLSGNPGILKELIKLGMRHCADSQDFHTCMYMVERRFFGSALPPDFGSWCLEQAIASENHDKAAWFMRKVAHSVRFLNEDESFSQKIVESRLAGNAALKDIWLAALQQVNEIDVRERNIQEEHKSEKRQRQRQWQERVKEHEAALQENRALPALLHELAQVYFGRFIDVEGETPLERLQDIFGGDERLVEVILKGLRGSVGRSDVPDVAEIIRLEAENQSYYLALPFLAGLEEIARITPVGDLPLNEKQMRQAFAFLYAETQELTSGWYERASIFHPEAAADVLVRTVRAEMRSGNSSFSGAYRLDESKEIARLAVLPLLELFPVRCTTLQLEVLAYLLKTALLHCEETPLLELIHGKLAHRSMNVAQRIYWLAIGFLISPGTYREKLESYVAGGDERRVRHLANIICRNDLPTTLINRLVVQELDLLIRLLGPSYNHSLSPLGAKANRIQGFINQLASVPSQAATEALKSLSSEENLRSWRSYLIDAAYRQNAVRREASFRHCDIGQVLETLESERPANAADLAALTLEFLREIAKTIRHGNTSDWRQYWSGTPDNRPRPENYCRDALLSNLRQKLSRLGIDAQQEGYYADDKRSDIRVSFGDFNIPIEIKRSCHRELWSAIKTQLILKYTRDPGTDGYGIYLVFWFGDTEHCRPTPGEGASPKSTEEIEKRLRSTLSADERLKISICIIDVSEPG